MTSSPADANTGVQPAPCAIVLASLVFLGRVAALPAPWAPSLAIAQSHSEDPVCQHTTVIRLGHRIRQDCNFRPRSYAITRPAMAVCMRRARFQERRGGGGGGGGGGGDACRCFDQRRAKSCRVLLALMLLPSAREAMRSLLTVTHTHTHAHKHAHASQAHR